MTLLTTDIHTDSKFIKILTFIAVLYAPASLVAVGIPNVKSETLFANQVDNIQLKSCPEHGSSGSREPNASFAQQRI